ncbi:hypothetical protein BGX27_007054 [Mortierella sp. AM989]|nr:hypothetical protein BGX27_007054 [Mortierella sp. AM989]
MNTNTTTGTTNALGAYDTDASSPQPHNDIVRSSSPPRSFPQKARSTVLRYYSSLSYSFKRKLLRNIRLLILVMAFVALILDAITVSFEVNVMNLDLSNISAKTVLLLVPDILAIAMSLILLIYTSEAICCCFGTIEDEDEEEAVNYNQNDDIDAVGTQDERETDQSFSSRLHERRGQQEHKDKDRKQEQEQDEEKQEDDDEVLTRSRRNRVAFVNYPETMHQARSTDHQITSTTPTITITSYNNASTSNNTSNSASTHTHVYTHSPSASIDVPISPSASSNTASRSASILSPAPASPTEALSPPRATRFLLYYVIFRILFSLGLAALALYWPVHNPKPPSGNLSGGGGLPKYPHANNELRNDTEYGYASGAYNGMGDNYTFDIEAKANGYRVQGKSSGNSSTYYGLRHWCAMEQAYGDDESATVYCRVRLIRPGLTYTWAVLVILELGAAAMAGDFSKNRGQLRTGRTAVEDDVEDDEGKGKDLSGRYGEEELGSNNNNNSYTRSAEVMTEGTGETSRGIEQMAPATSPHSDSLAVNASSIHQKFKT